MEAQIKRALESASADYAEIRVHRGRGTHVAYVGRELEGIGESTSIGGCVRALVNGGWGFTCFNDLDQLPRYVAMACEQAKMVGGGDAALAPAQPRVDRVAAEPEEDPAGISLAEKEALCRRYNDRILGGSKKIQSSSVCHSDSRAERHFANTEGACLVQETVFCGASLFAIARDNGNVQYGRHSVGDLRGYQIVRDLDEKCDETVKQAVDLLSAKPVDAGRYTVIMDPRLCGVFIHEAFGHLSEADFLYENPRLLEIMKPGRRFGRDFLTIVDDGTMPGEAGTIFYDSEGTPASRTELIRDGVLTSRLHSRETAAKMNEALTGNARAISYAHAPIVRMTNTYMEPRDHSFEEMLAETDDGLYAIGFLGGQTDMEMFTFSAEYACRIRGGKLAEKVRDVVLTGNVFQTLQDIDMIGNDLTIHGGLGGCGKGGQSPLRVGDGGPHARVRNVVVGGK